MTVAIEDDDNQKDNIPLYWSGIRFYYHRYYQYNTNHQEKSQGMLNEKYGNIRINPKYKYCDWFIEPKHKNIKEELMNDD